MNRLNHMTSFHDDSINLILTYLQEKCYNVKRFSVTEEEAIFSDIEMSGIWLGLNEKKVDKNLEEKNKN